MATIVRGVACSHSPQLNVPPETWFERANWDRDNAVFSFSEALARAPENIGQEINIETFTYRHNACQEAISRLHDIYVACAPDVVVIVGGDQREMFLDDGVPAFCVYRGESVLDIPRDRDKLHPSSLIGEWAYHGTETVERPTEADLGEHLTSSLTQSGFDVGQMLTQPKGRSIGHAFTFIHRRIMMDPIVPIVPVLVNCDHPINQPTASRCWDFGEALRTAIDDWSSDARVMLVASGGLSHFEVMESWDREVLEALRTGDRNWLGAISKDQLVLGTAEINNWIVVGAAMHEDFSMEVVDYVPAYRSEGGTGCGMGFVEWHR